MTISMPIKLTIISRVSDLASNEFVLGGKRAMLIGPSVSVSFMKELSNQQVVKDLMQYGFVSFAVVGPDSELVHDTLDFLLEELGCTHVLTTWHTDDSFSDIISYCDSMSFLVQNLVELVAVLDPESSCDRKLAEALTEAFRANTC